MTLLSFRTPGDINKHMRPVLLLRLNAAVTIKLMREFFSKQSAIWVTSITLDNWQFYNTPLIRLGTSPSIGVSEIHRYLHSGHIRTWSPSWRRCSTERVIKTREMIAYWSQPLNDAECAYKTARKEWLAVVWAVLLLMQYLEGAGFKVWTNHDELHCVLKLLRGSGRFVLWNQRSFECEFNVVHRPSVKHKAGKASSATPSWVGR